MRASIRILPLALAAAVLIAGTLVGTTPAAAQQAASASASADNVKITVRIGSLDGRKKTEVKPYELIVVAGGDGSQLLAGSRVPIPTSSADDPKIVYQNVGFQTEVRALILADGRIHVRADIEDSRLVPGDAGGPPTVETRQLSSAVVVRDGESVELTRGKRVADEDRSGYVELEATVVR